MLLFFFLLLLSPPRYKYSPQMVQYNKEMIIIIIIVTIIITIGTIGIRILQTSSTAPFDPFLFTHCIESRRSVASGRQYEDQDEVSSTEES